jgi:meso-butanediol dehydrogenase / (S,S)-butanediol dehydrogenase / diacetyl reductase
MDDPRNSSRVLITGGASGIGEAISHRFMSEDCRVGILDCDRKGLDQLKLNAHPPDLLILADVRDPESINEAFLKVDAAWGRIDVLCNNAGISIRSPFLETTLQDWQRVLSVNLTGAFLVAQQAARRMFASAGGGVIVNVGSVSGIVGMQNYVAYNVSKAGIIALTKTMALELAPKVRVNSVCPGYVLTPMQKAEYSHEMLDACAEMLPMRRLGLPEEIASLVYYLASDSAGFITGQSYVIDGGESAGGLASRS